MFGITNHDSFVVTELVFLALALMASTLAKMFLAALVVPVNAISGKLKQNRIDAPIAHRAAGIFLIGFDITLTTN